MWRYNLTFTKPWWIPTSKYQQLFSAIAAELAMSCEHRGSDLQGWDLRNLTSSDRRDEESALLWRKPYACLFAGCFCTFYFKFWSW